MLKFPRRTFLGLLLLLGSGISDAFLAIERKPLPENIKGWSPDWLIGTTWNLISETRDSQFHFGENGNVALTEGPKGGPWAAPLLSWQIKDGKLFVGESTQPDDGLEFVSITGNTLRARSRGKEAVYEIFRH